MVDQKAAYRGKLEAQLDKVDAQLKAWRAEAEKADADARMKYHDEIESLENKQQQISGDAWDEMRQGIERAMNDLSHAIDRAGNRLN